MNEININIKIKNIPNPEDYFDKSKEIFIETLDDITTIMFFSKRFGSENYKKKYIKIMTNIHYLSEIYLSGLILENNALDLIKIDSINGNKEIDFDDCVSVQANQLYDIAKTNLKKDLFSNSLFSNIKFYDVYNRNRKLRNKNMHSIIRNIDINPRIILIDFLSVWNVFFRKNNFIKDFYKLIINNDLKFKDLQHERIHNRGFEIESFDFFKTDFLKSFEEKITNRRYLFKFIDGVSYYLKKQELIELIECKEDYRKNFCCCPNCEIKAAIKFDFKSFFFDMDDISRKEHKPTKTLIIEKSQNNAKCYVCGYKVNKNMVKKLGCKCNKNAYFINHKIKYDYNKNEYFCMYCGELKDNDLSCISIGGYY